MDDRNDSCHDVECVIFDNEEDDAYWSENHTLMNGICDRLSSHRRCMQRSALQVMFRSRMASVNTDLYPCMYDAVFSFKPIPTE